MGYNDGVANNLSKRNLILLIAKIVEEQSGNFFGEKQLSMIEGRISHRLIELKMSVDAYYEYLLSHQQEESQYLLGAMTTHHTYFFREFRQINSLRHVLPKIISDVEKSGRKELMIWSAACSRGHEVLTLAMFFEKHLQEYSSKIDYRIVGTDVDPESVGIAKNGVYRKEELDRIPLTYVANMWQRGKGELANFVRMKPDVMKKCDYSVHNLLLPMTKSKFDIILARNVLIYFDKERLRVITRNLEKALHPDGVLLCGASEAITDTNDLKRVSPSVYAKTNSHHFNTESNKVTDISTARPIAKGPIRVVCVDDSKTVLKLLGKILTKENGFEIVGTALDGVEAESVIRKLKPDVVTLDIHMPNKTGIEYLQQNFSSSHPPVIMVSSANRDDAATALRALELGASDFVEKPSLETFTQVAEELCTKIEFLGKSKQSLSLERSFSKSVTLENLDHKLVYLRADARRAKDLKKLIYEIYESKIPLVLDLGTDDFLKNEFVHSIGEKCMTTFLPEVPSGLSNPQGGTVYVMRGTKQLDSFTGGNNKVVYCELGDSELLKRHGVSRFKNTKFILEDGFKNEKFSSSVNYVVPLSSYYYHVVELLNSFNKENS